MKNLFDIDGGVMSFLSRATDLLILNIVFLITCIPIVTIGPALAALFSITLKMVKGEESYVFTGYFKAFKANFKISIVSWLILMILFYLSYIDFRIAKTLDNTLSIVLSTFFFVMLFMCSLTTLYLFPYIARFQGSLKQSFKNAILIAIASLPYTLLLIIITVAFVGVASLLVPRQYSILIWLLCGFALLSLLQSWVFRRVFAKYEPSSETVEEVDN